jgi:hypothetical protein
MKKILIIFALVLILAGCKQVTDSISSEIPTVTTETTETTPVVAPETPAVTLPVTTPTAEVKPYYVKNSKWVDVDITKLMPAKSARSAVSEPSLDDALVIVANYNAANNDDQLRLDTTDIPITEAPDVDVYYAQAVNGYYVVIEHYIVNRVWFSGYEANYRNEAISLGYVLFIDKVPEIVPPPPPVVIDTRTPHEKYAIYMINKYDKIVIFEGYKYEQHVDEIWDSLSDEIKAGYNNDINVLFNSRLAGFQKESNYTFPEDAPWRVVSGQIYVEPVDPPPEDTPAE